MVQVKQNVSKGQLLSQKYLYPGSTITHWQTLQTPRAYIQGTSNKVIYIPSNQEFEGDNLRALRVMDGRHHTPLPMDNVNNFYKTIPMSLDTRDEYDQSIPYAYNTCGLEWESISKLM